MVGDGAVGLSGVLAARRLGAGRIIALGRNPVRQEVAREFGATDVVEERGEAATEAVMELTRGVGVDGEMFFRNKGVRGGSAPARAYIPELLPDVLEGRINPGRAPSRPSSASGACDDRASPGDGLIARWSSGIDPWQS